MPITTTCAHCGRAFDYFPSEQSGRFCSRKCSSAGVVIPLEERFFAKVQKTDGCWLWTASLNKAGYGQIYAEGRPQHASRISWRIHNGAIPAGLHVCHHCDNPRCVRPDHLFLGTRSDNMQDMLAKGRNGAITHPEKLARGSRHGKHTRPDLIRRGKRPPRAK
jgi:hypothetical protein